MTTKETKNFKTIETLRERERESLNLSKLSFVNCAKNINKIEINKKDRLKYGREKTKITLLYDSLSFL